MHESDEQRGTTTAAGEACQNIASQGSSARGACCCARSVAAGTSKHAALCRSTGGVSQACIDCTRAAGESAVANGTAGSTIAIALLQLICLGCVEAHAEQVLSILVKRLQCDVRGRHSCWECRCQSHCHLDGSGARSKRAVDTGPI